MRVRSPALRHWSQTRMAARLAAGGTGTFVLLLAILHLLRPDLDPTWRVISEYELGPYGFLMRAAFLALGLGAASLTAAAFPNARSGGGYLGLALLALSAIGMGLAGLFVTDPLTAAPADRTSSGRLHELGAMLDAVPFAAPLISYSVTRHGRTEPAGRWLRALAWLPLLGTLLFMGSLAYFLPGNNGAFGPAVPIGIPNRVMIVAHCGWLLLAAAYLRRPATVTRAVPVEA